MRWTRRIVVALGVLAATALALAPRPAAAKEEEPDLLARIRKNLRALDVSKIDYIALDVGEQSDAELQEGLAELAKYREFVMKKWKEVQREKWRFYAILSPAVRAGYTVLEMASLELERKERIEAIWNREEAAFRAQFGHSRKIETERTNRELWYASREAKEFAREREAVGTWFRQAVKEEARRAKAGETKAGKLMEELEAECQAEMAAISSARSLVTWEIRRRERRGAAGEQPTDPDPDAKQNALRVAPIRTEYEATTGEPVEFLYQVWGGAKPYAWVAQSGRSTEGVGAGAVGEPGEASFVLTFSKPGTFPVVLAVTDGQGETKGATYTVTVTGAPLKPGTPRAEDGTAKDAGTGGDAPVPFHGTFDARIWGADAGYPRDDTPLDETGFHMPSVPARVTVDPSGAISATVRYEVPESEIRPRPPFYGMHWKVSFDLSGRVDWTTGKVRLEIANGTAESGYENDRSIGHWRNKNTATYSAVLEGFAMPSPGASAWLAAALADPTMLSVGRPSGSVLGFEDLGLPNVAVTTGPDGKTTHAFADRGFFGASLLTGAFPGLRTPRRRTFASATAHDGYDERGARDVDDTAGRNRAAAGEADQGMGFWYVKILGAPPATTSEAPTAPAAPPPEPKDRDLLAFGLWPTKPIHVQPGAAIRPRAMGVFSRDVYEAADLSGKARWSVPSGLTRNADGSFVASAPGTYRITAETDVGGQTMSSTITVVVEP